MKYELTEETKKVRGITVRRIKALKDFSDVKAGDLGGWIEAERNLSQNGECWVSGDARVFENAMVYGNARVFGDTRVFGNAMVYGDARVFGGARVYGGAMVYGDAKIS